jgi:hypothetical protein
MTAGRWTDRDSIGSVAGHRLAGTVCSRCGNEGWSSTKEMGAMSEDATEQSKGNRPRPRRATPSAAKVDGAVLVAEKIAEAPEPWRTLAERLDALIRSVAPDLEPRLWYGMPAYARDGKVVCFFRTPDRFDERYLTLGFNDVARLDDGNMWPIAFAIVDLTPAEEERIVALVRRAVR